MGQVLSAKCQALLLPANQLKSHHFQLWNSARRCGV